jgi:hypothetical protein
MILEIPILIESAKTLVILDLKLVMEEGLILMKMQIMFFIITTNVKLALILIFSEK